MRDAEIVASKSYQRGLGVGFYRTLQTYKRLDFEATRGWLRGYVLYIDDNPSAYWIGSLYRGTFYSEYMAYDPAHVKTAPGMYLAMEVLKELSAGEPDERATYVDFGAGEAEYKTRLGNHSWMETKVYVFAPGLRRLGLHVLWVAALGINFAGRRILNLTHVTQRLRQYWRSRITPKQRDKTDTL
jgi:CelD/BcsL family acetyltransferase involved in cellulose biosynthesis